NRIIELHRFAFSGAYMADEGTIF
ncbi:hypothetical protein CP08DC60_0213B, partial [Chlamydia psittaci 08DC60]